VSGAVGLIYFAGFIVTWVVLYHRAGFPEVQPDWREFLLPNLPWFGLMSLKFLFWPVTLASWFLTGRGPSPWRAVTEIDGRPARRIVRVPDAAQRYSHN
jgi:hypothetical protein